MSNISFSTPFFKNQPNTLKEPIKIPQLKEHTTPKMNSRKMMNNFLHSSYP